MGRHGRPRIASEEQAAEILRLHRLGIPMRTIAKRVFGAAALKDRVARIIAATPLEARELGSTDEEAIWEQLDRLLDEQP